jgi:hypothetical protein
MRRRVFGSLPVRTDNNGAAVRHHPGIGRLATDGKPRATRSRYGAAPSAAGNRRLLHLQGSTFACAVYRRRGADAGAWVTYTEEQAHYEPARWVRRQIKETGQPVGANPGTIARSSVPTCSSGANSRSPFIILDNQTYALCPPASCFVFSDVAYCACDVETGNSISLKFAFDDGQDVCTVNEEGAANGTYVVSTFSVPESVLKGGDMATYTCPSGSDGAYAQCNGGICFTNTEGQSFPGFDEPLAKNQIICSCPITEQNPKDPVGYQILGPYPCQQSFFENCNKKTANSHTGSTLHVGAPSGTGDLLAKLLTGSVPNSNKCFPPR